MSTHEQLSVAEIADEVRGWIAECKAVMAARSQVTEAWATAAENLTARTVAVNHDGEVVCRVLPLSADDVERVRCAARLTLLPAVPKDVQYQINHLVRTIGTAAEAVRAVTGFQRFFAFGGTRDSGRKAAAVLGDYHGWYRSHDLGHELSRIAPHDDPRVSEVGLDDAIASWVGLIPLLGEKASLVVLEPATTFAVLPNAIKLIRRSMNDESALRAAAVDAGNAMRRMETCRLLAEMPVERLRDATRNKIRVNALINVGIRTVLDVLANEEELQYFVGIGETSAERISGAARTILQSTFEETPARIDIKNRVDEHTALLRSLRMWEVSKKAAATPAERSWIHELAPLATAIDKGDTHALVFCPSPSAIDEFRESVREVARCARRIADAKDSATAGDPWDDFLSRPADYFALLAELGFITEDEEKSHGELPDEIIEAVRALELKTDYLAASLRGYQSFGARFALAQRKVIIGDEMGLGKTVEAIAVLAHLRAKGSHHFVVVCPAAVVTNWTREVAAKSRLTPHRLHGPDRNSAAKNWIRHGGVGVTTFETLAWLVKGVALPNIACVVVDEAHYIKNPNALRTQRTSWLIDSADHAVLLTGTPLENRIDEFRNLVSYLRPDLVVDDHEFAPRRFRRQVAPAYVRRNQEDVLDELPKLVEVDEWLALSGHDTSAYLKALNAGNFMALRQAAMVSGRTSSKMQRLIEIVGEAESNGRKVVVFSHFLEVLKQVAAALPGRVVGPLTGSVPAGQRQTMVDEFSSARDGAVLVAQILAGGVGLNIQAASVVVICEPQLKPTTEWQAIARAHRMGQLKSVQVHRLLSDEGVDLRIRDILAAKSQTFDEFARISETADSAPEAVDVSEAQLARDVIAAERERLFGGSVLVSAAQPSSDAVPESRVGLENGPLAYDAAKAAHEVVTPPRVDLIVPRSPQSEAARRVAFSDRPRRVVRVPSEGNKPEESSAKLEDYRTFQGRLPDISHTPDSSIVDNVVRIVEAEGPVLGFRIHEVYIDACAGQGGGKEVSRALNRAICQAERDGRIVAENPLDEAGVKPKIFRLHGQTRVSPRSLGPRALDRVPLSELAHHLVDLGGSSRASNTHELFVALQRRLGLRVLTGYDKEILQSAMSFVRSQRVGG